MYTPPIAIPGFTDPVSSLTHLLGAVVFAVLGVRLVRTHGHTAATRASLALFATGAVLLLALSGVFHLLPHGRGRVVLQRLDHAAIFVLIAATMTPVHVLAFSGPRRWGMLLAVWTAAIAGLTLKMVFFSSIPEWLGTSVYLGLGWLGGLSIWWLWRAGNRCLGPFVLGAAFYTGGAVLDMLGPRAPGLRVLAPIPGVLRSHELFHLAVLGGLACHWRAIAALAREAAVERTRVEVVEGARELEGPPLEALSA